MGEEVTRHLLTYFLDGISGPHNDQSIGVEQSFKELIELMLRSHLFHDRIGIADGTQVAARQLFKQSVHCLGCIRKLHLYTIGRYESKTFPFANARVVVNLRLSLSLIPSNIVLPLPSTTGVTTN